MTWPGRSSTDTMQYDKHMAKNIIVKLIITTNKKADYWKSFIKMEERERSEC